MKPLHHLHTYKEIPDFNIIGERLFLNWRTIWGLMEKNINPKKTHNPQSLPFVKDVACYDYILSQQSQEKKVIKGEKEHYASSGESYYIRKK